MLIDAVSASETFGKDAAGRAVASFLEFLERKLGVQIVRDARDPRTDVELAEPLHLAKLLQDKGIIEKFYRTNDAPDLPHMHYWAAHCTDETKHQTGGSTWDSEKDALMAALAEALERYIWFMKVDYFVEPTTATSIGIETKGRSIAPQRFSGYSETQRTKDPRRYISEESEFHWIRGNSLTHGDSVYIPSQVVTGVRTPFAGRPPTEPHIRPPITIGLATWPTQAGARCAGMNETLEREAYMIMWLNELTLPRYSLSSLRKLDPLLAKLIDDCEKYRLKMHVIKMPTDAPTHAVAVMIEDMSGIVPRFTIGIRAHRSLADAVLKGAGETVRAIRGHRYWTKQGNVWDPTTPAREVGHRDRLYYWGHPANAPRLEFLIAGPEIEAKTEAWDVESAEEHLERLVAWCREKNLEAVVVSLGNSPTNPTDLHIEMMVMPELQWTYLSEKTQAFGGTRWRDVPLSLGLTPRSEPYADEPHPFS